MKRLLLFTAASFVFMAAITARIYPYSFDAYNGMTGKGMVSLSPTLSFPVSPVFSSAVDLIGAYGLTPNFDLFVNAADFNLAPTAGYAYSWIMPRFEFLPNNIIALQLQLINTGPVSYNIAPQYHLFLENDFMAFEFNGIVTFPLNNTNASTTISGIIVPVWKAVKGILYPFIEIDPSYAFAEASLFNLNIVPGIWVGIPDTPHQFCLAFSLTGVTSGNTGYGVNFWYSVSFSTAADSDKKE